MNKDKIDSDVWNQIHWEVTDPCESKLTNQLFYCVTWARSAASRITLLENIIEDKLQEYGQINRCNDVSNRPDVHA